MRGMILAGDIGGTKTLIGLFEPHAERPILVEAQSYRTTEYPGLPDIIERFVSARPERPKITSAAFGGANRTVDVVSPGGVQRVEWTDRIWLTGVATLVAEMTWWPAMHS